MNFKETVEEFDRMCEFYDDETENPFYEETDSDEWEDWWMMAGYHPEKFNEIVEKFSHDHPKPIYPTLNQVLQHLLNCYNFSSKDVALFFDCYGDKPISEEVAREFGIMPINECGLTKYCDEGESEWR